MSAWTQINRSRPGPCSGIFRHFNCLPVLLLANGLSGELLVQMSPSMLSSMNASMKITSDPVCSIKDRYLLICVADWKKRSKGCYVQHVVNYSAFVYYPKCLDFWTDSLLALLFSEIAFTKNETNLRVNDLFMSMLHWITANCRNSAIVCILPWFPLNFRTLGETDSVKSGETASGVNKDPCITYTGSPERELTHVAIYKGGTNGS